MCVNVCMCICCYMCVEFVILVSVHVGKCIHGVLCIYVSAKCMYIHMYTGIWKIYF